MSSISVTLDASINPDGSVDCLVTCDGQQATVTFTGQDVFIKVPDPVPGDT